MTKQGWLTYEPQQEFSNKWIRHFLNMAREHSDLSKDPSTKVGAVIVRPNKTIASVGFNGFPIGCSDKPENYSDREKKYRRVVHAEMNAICFCNESMDNYTLFTYPFAPCPRCAGPVIQKGIKTVYYPIIPVDNQALRDRWAVDLNESMSMFMEAGVMAYGILDTSEPTAQHAWQDMKFLKYRY